MKSYLLIMAAMFLLGCGSEDDTQFLMLEKCQLLSVKISGEDQDVFRCENLNQKEHKENEKI
jgi:uncharacterized lipoprotein YmbA